jgi:glycosyltransferase involved in cell wall biosynthesis
MKNIRVLLQQRQLPHYRIPLFNKLAEKVDLTVLHGEQAPRELKGVKFKTVYSRVSWLGPFYIQRIPISSPQFDIVITELNLRNLVGNFLGTKTNRAFGWVAWGIGVSASYTKKFNENRKWDFLRACIYKKSDAVILYSEPARTHFEKIGFNPNKLIVASNTVEVNFSPDFNEKRDKFTFIGTLYKAKGLEDLISAYKNYTQLAANIRPLYIIGDGPLREELRDLLHDERLNNFVHLVGEVFNEKLLESYLRTSLFCVSPNQAGLTVLKAMGYGTPFVTRQNAITGGELFNLKNNENGLYFREIADLTAIFIQATHYPQIFDDLGVQARKHYQKHASIENFVSSFLTGINLSIAK